MAVRVAELGGTQAKRCETVWHIQVAVNQLISLECRICVPW